MMLVLLYSEFINNENGYHYYLRSQWDADLVIRIMEGSMTQTPEPMPTSPVVPVSGPPRQRITTADLMQGAPAIVVLHQGEEYLLRITKTGKLILTK